MYNSRKSCVQSSKPKVRSDNFIVLVIYLLNTVKQDAYFTDKKITAYEMAIMVDFYHVKSTPVYPWDLDEDKWPDYSYCTIEPTEDTEKIAVVMNYALANELFTYDAKAIEQYKKYGFSEENPITVAWIMDNPKKAVKIMRLIRDNRRYINEENSVYPAYEKITGETNENGSELK